MFVTYLSLDEVNQALAERTAEQCGAALNSLACPAELPANSSGAVVYDLDHFSATDRRQILDTLSYGPVEGIAVVHSYNLRPSQIRTLRENGVVVHRRLHPGWFGRLIRARVTTRQASRIHAA